ncbi:MAG: hypothetical protein RL224_473 [Actinomycetota bacterium]|jgi:hypothetical protein
MTRLEIGIPAYRNLRAALDKVTNLREGGFIGLIHVSINDPSLEDINLSHEYAEPDVKISLQKGNLGLYGNFRFLALNAQAPYFMWLALDDDPAWGVISEVESNRHDATLIYSRHFLKVSPKKGSAEIMYGPFDPLGARNIFNFDPSAIFGAWSTKWLQSEFPRGDFDWLDSYLLTSAYLDGKIKLTTGQRAIGAEMGKKPHNVIGSHHRFWGWFTHISSLIWRCKRWNLIPSFLISSLGRMRMIVTQIFQARLD